MRRYLQYAVLLSYLAITAAGLLYTVLRVRVPVLPWTVVRWSYGMMAPYQGIHPSNQLLRAEGRSGDGAWQDIDLQPYYPVGFGEYTMRMNLQSFKRGGPDAYLAAYRTYALRLQTLEEARGARYDSIRLWMDTWPRSADGYFALRKDPDLQSDLIIQIP